MADARRIVRANSFSLLTSMGWVVDCQETYGARGCIEGFAAYARTFKLSGLRRAQEIGHANRGTGERHFPGSLALVDGTKRAGNWAENPQML